MKKLINKIKETFIRLIYVDDYDDEDYMIEKERSIYQAIGNKPIKRKDKKGNLIYYKDKKGNEVIRQYNEHDSPICQRFIVFVA